MMDLQGLNHDPNRLSCTHETNEGISSGLSSPLACAVKIAIGWEDFDSTLLCNLSLVFF